MHCGQKPVRLNEWIEAPDLGGLDERRAEAVAPTALDVGLQDRDVLGRPRELQAPRPDDPKGLAGRRLEFDEHRRGPAGDLGHQVRGTDGSSQASGARRRLGGHGVAVEERDAGAVPGKLVCGGGAPGARPDDDHVGGLDHRRESAAGAGASKRSGRRTISPVAAERSAARPISTPWRASSPVTSGSWPPTIAFTKS